MCVNEYVVEFPSVRADPLNALTQRRTPLVKPCEEELANVCEQTCYGVSVGIR